MKIRGVVTQVRDLPAKDGKEPIKAVSVEGFSCLCRNGTAVPVEGHEIEGVVQVHWPRGGGRPCHFLTSWEDSI